MNENSDFQLLADFLADHLMNIRGPIDNYKILSKFPKFFYSGQAFRGVVVKNRDEVNWRKLTENYTSWSSSFDGVIEYLINLSELDGDKIQGSKFVIFTAQIEGFNVGKALQELISNGFLSERSNLMFLKEEEIVCFSVSGINQFKTITI
jgi:hypothetical protein